VQPRHDFEAIYREEGGRLWRVLMGMTGGQREVSEDAIAEAFARAMQRGSTIEDPRAYIFVSCIRLARREMARQKKQGTLIDEGRDDAHLAPLFSALLELAPNQRAAVMLRHVEGYSNGEVAALMGISAATARVHLHRGRRKLRSILNDEEVPNG
jgi:RNA polymerase sigma-70 factor (ECF subfamily)